MAARPTLVTGNTFDDDGLSMGKLLRHGFSFNLNLHTGMAMTGPDGRSVPVELRRNYLHVPVQLDLIVCMMFFV